MRPVRVTFYTRAQCSLCDEARALLHHASRDYPVLVEEVDVDGDPALVERYGDDVPVATIEETGRELFRLATDPTALAQALDAATR